MIRRLAAAAIAALALTVPSGAEDHDDHVSSLSGLRVVHAWTRATDGDVAYVFCEIENMGAADARLLGGESADGQTVALVGFRLNEAGQGVYATLPSLPVRAGGRMTLLPEGAAIRLSGLKGPLGQGTEFEMEFEFDVGHMIVHVAVEAADARNHSHAGHNH